MRFRTEYTIERKMLPPALNPDGIVLLGSCFSDNIGGMLATYGCDVTINPVGVVYNPASLAKIVELAYRLNSESIGAEEMKMVARDGKMASLYFASVVNGATEEELYARICEALTSLADALKRSETLIVTLGTAYVYSHQGEVVTNCHKLPEREFERRRLSVAECESMLEAMEANLTRLRDGVPMRVIYTVSPVRHLRDGFAENSRSKATLMLAVGEREYFPAYEILTDDLRDYRYYADDLLHPSRQGIEYIWEKFSETYFDSSTRQELQRRMKLLRQANHRPLI